MRRRRYLAAAGGVFGLLAGCGSPEQRPEASPTAAPAPIDGRTVAERGETRRRTAEPEPAAVEVSAFDRVVDAVGTVNCDPTGTDPCQHLVQGALGDGTLLRFPAGTYRFTGPVVANDVDRVGILGDGDVTFVVPAGFTDRLFHVEPVGQALFQNVRIDQTAAGASTGLKLFTRDGFHVENVEFVGRGLTAAPQNRACLLGVVTNPDATGIVRNLVAKKGSAWNRYKSAGGKTGIFVGTRNRGRVRIEDCHFEEMGGNGIYGSRHRGTVEVVGGLFRNNNVASIRIAGDGSFVDGATVEIDESLYTGPEATTDFAMRGIVIEQGARDTGGFKPAGAAVRNCEITVNPNPTPGDAVQVWSGGRSLTLEDTTITVNNTGSVAVNRLPAHPQGRHPPGPKPRWVRMKRVAISGSAAGASAVALNDAPGSRIEDCTVRQTGSDRDGVSLVRSTDCRFDGGQIHTTRYPIRYVTGDSAAESTCRSSCLFSLGRVPDLEATELTDELTADLVGTYGAYDEFSPIWLDGPTCVPTCVRLATDADDAAPLVIGITDIRCWTVFGAVGPATDGR